MPVEPRPEIADLELPVHGAVHATDLGRAASGVLDFSVSLSPLGPPPAVAAAIRAADPARYPDPTARPLLGALAERLGVPSRHLLAGNGSSELLWLAAMAFLRPGDRVLVIGPTYAEYARAAQVAGAGILRFTARKKDQFRLDLPALTRILEREAPRLVFLCNPNNPTGLYLRRREVLVVAAAFNGLVVVDEAYLDFVRDVDSLLDPAIEGRLLLMRSLTKGYALAGLRLGYAVGGAAAVEAMRRVQPPWSVNAVAQAAGLAALADEDYPERARIAVEEAREYLQTELAGLGFEIVPSSANFVLAGGHDAAKLSSELLDRGFAVRDCTSFQLPEHIRIGVRRIEDCKRLIAALRELVPSGRA
jgi:histidinol-phosphate aminotransferase